MLLQPQGNGLGPGGSLCELKTHLCPGDRGPHSRTARSPWWSQGQGGCSGGVLGWAGGALDSSALIGGFVSDVSVPVSFPAPRMFPLPLSCLI